MPQTGLKSTINNNNNISMLIYRALQCMDVDTVYIVKCCPYHVAMLCN